jgi:hypothetical protein
MTSKLFLTYGPMRGWLFSSVPRAVFEADGLPA